MTVRKRTVVGALALLWLAGCGGNSSTSSSTSGLSTTSSTSSSASDGAPGAGIFGRLVSTAQQPVSNAKVVLVDSANHTLSSSVTTDVDGQFQLDLSGTPPSTATLLIQAPNRPPARTDVTLESLSRVQIVLTQDAAGALTLQSDLQAPPDAVPVGLPGVVLLPLDAAGNSGLFGVDLRGRFAPMMTDLCLIYRGRPPARWAVGGGTPEAAGAKTLALRLGAAALGLHGQRIEVRALAAPQGKLNGGDQFTAPFDIDHDLVISHDPVQAIVVATRDNRLTASGFGPHAVIVPGAASGQAELSAADLQTLGWTAGQRVALTTATGHVTVTVTAANSAVLRLATLRLAGGDARTLGLDLPLQAAGYTIRGTPAP